MPGGSYAEQLRGGAAKTAATRGRSTTPTGARKPQWRAGSKNPAASATNNSAQAANERHHFGSAAYAAVISQRGLGGKQPMRAHRNDGPRERAAPAASFQTTLASSPPAAADPTLQRQGSGRSHQRAADALSGEIFRSKLLSIMSVREQIEALAAKHKTEEEALRSVLDSIKFSGEVAEEDEEDRRTQAELLQAVNERDRTIEMLDTFRREGNAVITRMHENLKRATDQHEQSLRKLEELQGDNAALRAEVAQLRSGGAPGDSTCSTVAEYEKRAQTYVELLSDADDVIRELREQTVVLQSELSEARKSNRAGSAGATAAEHATPSPRIQTMVEEMRDQLRTERRQRLQSEEQSQRILQEQQRHIDLLEQRLAQSQQSVARASTGGTPRTAGANRRGDTPSGTGAMTPTRSGFAQSRLNGSFEAPPPLDDSHSPAGPTPTAAEPQPSPSRSPDNVGESGRANSPSAGPPAASVGGSKERSTSPPDTQSATVAASPAADAPLAAVTNSRSASRDAGSDSDAESQDEEGSEAGSSDEDHAESMRRITDLQSQLDSLKASIEP